MNILVIGNGFDIAHKLNTRYNDFLNVISLFNKLEGVNEFTQLSEYTKSIEGLLIEKIFREYFAMKVSNTAISDETKIFGRMANENFWFIYFYMLNEDEFRKKSQGDWVDFEAEIKKVVIKVEKAMQEHGKIDSYEIEASIRKRIPLKINDFPDIIEMMEKDLDELIRCFEIYLEKFVDVYKKEQLVYRSPDIEELKIDKILSFNYTQTYEKLYSNGNVEYDYIHGRADINNTVDSNNMVLGIDEYLPDSRKDIDLDFISFKKYYQRINKGIEGRYKSWLRNIEIMNRLKNPIHHNLYIFGHSLDISDGDILKELILEDNVYTTIFYLDSSKRKRLIKNLVAIIGQDELKKRTVGDNRTIILKKQRDMIIV